MSMRDDFLYGRGEDEELIKKVRKDTLRDGIDRVLWNFLGRDETHVEIFKMSNAWQFFMQLLETEPRGDKCLLSVEKTRSGYVITQVLMDKKERPIYTTTKACYGRRIQVETLDISVQTYMDMQEVKIMQNPNKN